MRVGYCVLHSQDGFVIQDASCAINHFCRVARVDVKGQVPQASTKATAEAAKAKARAIKHSESMPRAHRTPRCPSASGNTQEVNVVTCRWWRQEKTTQLVEAMAVVTSCGRTTRGRSSPLSAHLHSRQGKKLDP